MDHSSPGCNIDCIEEVAMDVLESLSIAQGTMELMNEHYSEHLKSHLHSLPSSSA